MMNMKFQEMAKVASIVLLAGAAAFGTVQACTASQQIPVNRATCYAAADHAAQIEAEQLCPADAGLFTKCAIRDEILSHQKAWQQACP